MLELYKKISNIRLSRQNQIIIAVLALCLLIYILSSSLMNLNNNVGNLKKENAITISRIEFLAAIGEQEISFKSAFSSNFASSVNSSAKDNKLKIDRTLPLSNNEISIWIVPPYRLNSPKKKTKQAQVRHGCTCWEGWCCGSLSFCSKGEYCNF